MTAGTNPGRAGSPSAFAARQSAATARRRLPAARPFANHGAHGVTRPTQAPIFARNWNKVGRNIFYISGILALVIAPWFCGCVTEAQANARAKAAYHEGQKAAFASMAGLGQGVVIAGPVEHPNVPWVEGLTLAQAIATANYTSHRNPKAITIPATARKSGLIHAICSAAIWCRCRPAIR